jgi:CHAD domain-containing protein
MADEASPLDAVLGWLGAARAAARTAPRDPEALHRFRVGVRRAAAVAEIARKPGGFGSKRRRLLRRALRATGPLRDRHVAEAWLENYARRSAPAARAAPALAAEMRRTAPQERPKPRWWRRIGQALDALRRRVDLRSPDPGALRVALRRAAADERRRCARRLQRLDRGEAGRSLHKARISVKRLRYLLEALETPPRGLPPAAGLRGLQKALGDAHDRDVIAAALRPAARRGGPSARTLRALAQLRREKAARLAWTRRRWRRLLALPAS